MARSNRVVRWTPLTEATCRCHRSWCRPSDLDRPSLIPGETLANASIAGPAGDKPREHRVVRTRRITIDHGLAVDNLRQSGIVKLPPRCVRDEEGTRSAGSAPSTRRNFRSRGYDALNADTAIARVGRLGDADDVGTILAYETANNTTRVSPPPLATSSSRWSLHSPPHPEPNVSTCRRRRRLQPCADVSGTAGSSASTSPAVRATVGN